MKTDDYLELPLIPIGIGFAIFLTLLILFCSFCSVAAGSVGVVTLFGKISPEVLPPGAHFINPLATVHPLNIKVLTTTTQSEAASKDLQTVDTTIVVNYNLTAKDPTKFYSQFGSDENYLQKSIIQPAVGETFKAVVARYTAEDLINKRELVSADIVQTLSDKLKEYNFHVDSVNITNFQFSRSFNEAIEAKVTAQQKVLTAQNDLARIQVEAQQKIVEAQANAKAMDLQKQIVTPELIQLKEIENTKYAISKWNGILPMYSGSNIPFIINSKP
jgi:regulator of protease activity HflC (stomatin/prohibitin superfamily)